MQGGGILQHAATQKRGSKQFASVSMSKSDALALRLSEAGGESNLNQIALALNLKKSRSELDSIPTSEREPRVETEIRQPSIPQISETLQKQEDQLIKKKIQDKLLRREELDLADEEVQKVIANIGVREREGSCSPYREKASAIFEYSGFAR